MVRPEAVGVGSLLAHVSSLIGDRYALKNVLHEAMVRLPVSP